MRLAALVLLVLAPTCAFAQAFEGVVTAKMLGTDSGREPVEAQYYVRDGVLRVEMAARGRGGDAHSVIIMDPAAKTNYVLMPAQRMYMVMPTPTGSSEQRHPDILKTGRKETVAGHECEHWLVKEPTGDIDACVATGLGTFLMSGGMGREAGWSGSLREQQGFPLKVARAGGATIMEVTKIERKRLDPALFAPPADYQKMEMPAGMPRPRP
jgi:hypothetical protein